MRKSKLVFNEKKRHDTKTPIKSTTTKPAAAVAVKKKKQNGIKCK